jgi:hypothetical protein
MSEQLDPATLRAIAAQLDEREAHWRRACNCPLHRMIANFYRQLASDLRTQAITAINETGGVSA